MARAAYTPTFILAGVAIIFTQCKKTPVPKDTIPPVITITWPINDTFPLNYSWLPNDAVAIDDKDGDISHKIVVSGNLDVNRAGSYTRQYDVKDAAGNSAITKTRSIIVVNQANYLAGDYSALCISSAPKSGNSSQTSQTYTSFTTAIAASEKVNNQLVLSYYPLSPFIITVSVSTNSLSPALSGGGNGSVSANKNGFTLTGFESVQNSSLTRTCSCTFVRKS